MIRTGGHLATEPAPEQYFFELFHAVVLQRVRSLANWPSEHTTTTLVYRLV